MTYIGFHGILVTSRSFHQHNYTICVISVWCSLNSLKNLKFLKKKFFGPLPNFRISQNFVSLYTFLKSACQALAYNIQFDKIICSCEKVTNSKICDISDSQKFEKIGIFVFFFLIVLLNEQSLMSKMYIWYSSLEKMTTS